MTGVRSVGVREGYDLWAATYDRTANPVVAMDERHVGVRLAARSGEKILDAGCGTGRHLLRIAGAGATGVGIDFSAGMLREARSRCPGAALARADLGRGLPFGSGSFDAAVSSLVGEHLDSLPSFFGELARVLRPEGRLVFSVYHPAMAAAGAEANFETDGVQYRLGAVRHTVEDYRRALEGAGFVALEESSYRGDESLALEIPRARKYVGFPILLVLEARRGR